MTWEPRIAPSSSAARRSQPVRRRLQSTRPPRSDADSFRACSSKRAFYLCDRQGTPRRRPASRVHAFAGLHPLAHVPGLRRLRRLEPGAKPGFRLGLFRRNRWRPRYGVLRRRPLGRRFFERQRVTDLAAKALRAGRHFAPRRRRAARRGLGRKLRTRTGAARGSKRPQRPGLASSRSDVHRDERRGNQPDDFFIPCTHHRTED